MAKKNYFVTLLVMSLIAALLLTVIGWAYNEITNASAEWGAILGLFAAAGLVWWAMHVNKGKESFIEWLPKVLVVMAVVAAIAVLWPTAPFHFTIEFSQVSLANILSGIGLAFGTVFLASSFTEKVLSKM